MKNLVLIILFWPFLFASCKKDAPMATTVNTTKVVPVAEQKEISKGTFKNGAHPTSGNVTIGESKTDAKKRFLNFTMFNTDKGPDLYVYLAEDLKAGNFVSLGKLTIMTDFQLEVPEGTDITKKKHVLIWCQQFGVLFGSADL